MDINKQCIISPPNYVYITQEILEKYSIGNKKSLPLTVLQVPSKTIKEYGVGWYIDEGNGTGFVKCDQPVLTDEVLQQELCELFKADFCEDNGVGYTIPKAYREMLKLTIDQLLTLRNTVRNHLTISDTGGN